MTVKMTPNTKWVESSYKKTSNIFNPKTNNDISKTITSQQGQK